MKSSAEITTAPKPVHHGDKKPFIQKKNNAGFIAPLVQPKLKIGKPDDPFEKEAEHISEKITERAPAPFIQKKCKTCEEKEKEIQKCCDKEPPLQRKPEGNAPVSHSSSLESSLASSKGKGQSISDPVRSTMESGFGTRFDHVRIHTDSSAVSMTQNLQAQAFTHGQDIYFNKGKYNPTSTEGKSLLAHELTHTIQQGGGIQRKGLDQNTLAHEIQSEEEEVDLKKELADSNQAARDAIDPGPARKSRAHAAAIQAENNQKAKKKHSGKKGGGAQKLPKKGGLSAEAKKAKAAAMALKEEEFKKSLGPVGKALSEGSSFACAKADQKSDQLATNEKTHDDETKKQEKTEQAVIPPTEEGQAMSNQEQVQQLDNATPPQPDKENARRTLQHSLTEAMPKNISEINAFESKGKAQVIGNQVLGNVSEEVGQVQDKYNDIEQPPPPKPTVEPTELPPNEVAPPTGALNIGKGAVPALQPEHSDTKEFENKSDDLLAKENIPEEQLAMVDKGDLAEVNTGRKELKKKVAEEPVKIKEEAKKETLSVEKGLQQEEAKGKSEMRNKRTKGLDQTKDKQTKTKTELEKKREAVTAHIQGIYNRAKKSVTDKLSNLEKQNLKDFDAGQHSASVQFEYEVKRDIDAWKSDRYSGLFGGVRWLKDKFVGIDHFPEVQQALTRGRENYIRRIDELIVSIDKANQLVITQCKAELAQAQVEIAQYVKNLGPELKATGQAAMKDMKAKLAEMDKYIDDQKNKLREKLCSKREEAIKAIDKRIEQMKEEMSGLLSKLGNLILDALIKFFKWALEKAGYSPQELMKIINTGRAVIKKIVTSPGGFFSNLAKAVKGGVNNFKNNIEQHLIKGMLGWLTGAMSDSGLQLPTTWDVKGILFLLLQILGLTKEIILKKLSDKVGKPVVDAAMKVAGFVKRVVDEGPGALWEMLKEQAESLKEKVLSTVRNWVSFEMIKQGVIKLVSMLNPVGAIVQLIIGIYNAVMFFIENWSRIVEFVKTIFGSIADIAFGRLGPAMGAVEKALGMTIPIILNFLARMLGLSGIGKAIKKAIDAIRAPIDRIVDKGIEVVGNGIKSLVAKVTGKKTEKEGKEEKAESAEGKITAPPKEIGTTIPFETTKHKHKVYIERVGTSYEMKVASVPQTVANQIKDWKIELKKPEWDKREITKGRIETQLKSIPSEMKAVDKKSKAIEVKVEKGIKPTPDEERELREAEVTVSNSLKFIYQEFDLFEGTAGSDVDFKVVFAGNLKKIHNEAEAPVYDSINKIPDIEKGKGFSKIQSWTKLQDLITNINPTKQLYTSPLGHKGDSGYTGHSYKQVITNADKVVFLKGAPQDKIDKTIQNVLKGVVSGTRVFQGLRDQIFDKTMASDVDRRIQDAYNSQGEHSRYHPEDIKFSVVGDEFVISYTYKSEPGEKSPTFIVKMKAQSVPGGKLITQTVVGSNLMLKEKGSRGVTHTVFNTQAAGAPDLNSAHIIADRFMGSGYKGALNLLATSDHFNKKTMGTVENQIAKEIEAIHKKHPGSDIYFTLQVTVNWKTNGDNEILKQFDILDHKLKEEDLKAIHEVLSKKQDPRRCEKVEYITTVFKDGAVLKTLDSIEIGPDSAIITNY